MESYVLFVFIVAFVALMAGLTAKQTKEFSEYLKSQGAVSEDRAIILTTQIRSKYRLAVPIFSGMKLKVTKDKKYWVAY